MIHGFDCYSGSHGGERGAAGARPLPWHDLAQIKDVDGSRKYCFAAIKATEGTNYGNSWFEEDWNEAQANDFAVLAYHYALPSTNSGHAEADYLIDFIGTRGAIRDGNCLALDSEDIILNKMGLGHADLLAHHLDFFRRIEWPLAFKPFLYSAPWYMAPHNLMTMAGRPVDAGHAELATHGYWGAQYGPLSLPTNVPAPWDFAAIRQWQTNAPLPGVVGLVDLDVFYGTVEQLKSYGWGRVADPGAGKLVAGTPDIPLIGKGAARDVTQAAVRIAANIEQARRLYAQRNTPLDALLATSQGDAAAIALVSGLLP